jgi:hypothetical protein
LIKSTYMQAAFGGTMLAMFAATVAAWLMFYQSW